MMVPESVKFLFLIFIYLLVLVFNFVFVSVSVFVFLFLSPSHALIALHFLGLNKQIGTLFSTQNV